MKITSVEPQKKNPRRFNIFLDGKFAFGADEDTVVNFRLVLGKEIAKEDLDKLLFEVEVGKLMERMYGLFNVRLRSEKEIRDYLKRLSFKRKVKNQEELSEVVIDSLIQRLIQKDLINDQRFAKEWVEARRKSQKKGINAIKFELYQKGIARETIEEVVGGVRDGESEVVLAEQALEKKARVWQNLEKNQFKQKAVGFLMRKGFEYQVCKEVIEKFLKKE